MYTNHVSDNELERTEAMVSLERRFNGQVLLHSDLFSAWFRCTLFMNSEIFKKL